MKNGVCFQSDYYRSYEWRKIFNQAGSFLLEDFSGVGIVNARGFLLASSKFISVDKIKLFFERGSITFDHDQLKEFSEPFIKEANLFLYKINHYFSPSDTLSESYFIFIKNIIFLVFKISNVIFEYTYDHLSHRRYANRAISTIDSVKSEFLEVTLKLDQLSTFISSVETIETASYVLNELVDIMTTLSRLGGARALLKNNAIEIAYNLRFFIKFIEMPL